MANANRGEYAFMAGGKEYTLRFSANALCELEDALEMSIVEISRVFSDSKNLRMKSVRATLWAGLREKHPEVTLTMAGEILQELTLFGATEHIGKAFALAYPEVESNPQKPVSPKVVGIGPAS